MKPRSLALLQVGLLLLLACDSGTSPVAPSDTIFTMSADPLKIRPGETSEIRVVALHKSGVPARTGTEIRFTTNLGTIQPEVARTDGDGVALATLTAGGRTGTAKVEAKSGAQNAGFVNVEIAVPDLTAGFEDSSADRLLSVKFTDDSNGDPTTWEWDFGDNRPSPERNRRNPQHDYREAGSYRVTLKVSNSDAADEISKLLRVGVIVGFEIDAAKSKGLEVAFRDTSDPVPTSWSWRFGDGARSTLQNPVHTYAASGEYRVRLEVTTLNSGSDHTRRVIAVEADLPDPPIAAFNRDPPKEDRNGLTIIFRDGSGKSGGGKPTSWHWDFGDGGTSTERDPIHTFPAPDTYAVTLTVANAAGSDSISQFVDVQ